MLQSLALLLTGLVVAGLVRKSAASLDKFTDGSKCSSNTEKPAKREIPTFVGSDGITRRVSPAAILEEMKRCLPPGIPLPSPSVWPELPENLGLEDTNQQIEEDVMSQGFGVTDKGVTPENSTCKFKINFQHQDGSWDNQEKKRVQRSNDGTAENGVNGIQIPDASFKTGDEAVPGSVVFSPNDPQSKNLVNFLKDVLLQQQLGGNSSRGTNSQSKNENQPAKFKRSKKPKNDDYEDYEYEETDKTVRNNESWKKNQDPDKPNETNERAEHSNHKRSGKKRKPGRFDKMWKHSRSDKVRLAKRRPKDVMEYYDYNDTTEDDLESGTKKETMWPTRGNEPTEKDELMEQMELNEYLQSLGRRSGRKPNDEIGMKREGFAASDHNPLRSVPGGPLGETDGYQKTLSAVMKLNANLIKLLEQIIFASICKKAAGKRETEEAHTGSAEWAKERSLLSRGIDNVGGEMRERERNKSPTGSHFVCHTRRPEEDSKSQPSPHNQPSDRLIHQTDLNLLKWLLNWYIRTTSL